MAAAKIRGVTYFNPNGKYGTIIFFIYESERLKYYNLFMESLQVLHLTNKNEPVMKSLSISIPSPCTEKWEKFAPASAGRHCGTCNEVVVDFTRMTDDEVLAYFDQRHGHTCGRFRPDQMKIYAHAESVRVRPGMMLLKAGLMSLLLALISRPSFAQEKIGEVQTEVVDGRKVSKTETKSDSEGQVIKGVVLARGEEDPLPGVNIVLQGTEVGTISDAYGRFEFPEKLKQGDVLVFYFIGMEANEYRVGKDTGSTVEIRMMCDYSIMGSLMIDTTALEEPSKLQRVISKVKGLF